nr:MAG TPA: hypothetical protein [Inoviridae sp.]
MFIFVILSPQLILPLMSCRLLICLVCNFFSICVISTR